MNEWYHKLIPLIYSGVGYSFVRYIIYGMLRKLISRVTRLIIASLVVAIAIYLFVHYWHLVSLPGDLNLY